MPKESAVAEAPELSPATPADSAEAESKVSLETETPEPPEEPAEAVAEAEEPAEAETPEAAEPSIQEQIKALDPAVREEVIRLSAGDSEYLKELLRRERQSAVDSVTGEQERRRAQQEDTDRILNDGRAAISDIGRIMAEAQTAIEAGDGRIDTKGLYTAIDRYRNAWVAGQAATWNRELSEAFTGQDLIAASFTEAEGERLGNALKAANRQGSRTPLLKEMFGLSIEKALEKGYELAMEDMGKLDKHHKALEGKKDGLAKLKGAIPPKTPTGTPTAGTGRKAYLRDRYREGTGTATEDAEYRRILDDEQAKR